MGVSLCDFEEFDQPPSSCFLAVKHASAAMKQTNEARGKPLSGGSIILTASGLFSLFWSSEIQSVLRVAVTVAGIRAGAGPVDCKFDAWVTYLTFSYVDKVL